MTEKRFIVDSDFVEYPKLVDTHTDCFYHIADDIRNVEIFCERLNKLAEENELLKQKLENLDLNEKNDMVKMIDGKVFIRM